MRQLAEPLRKRKRLRVIGFDDAPFRKNVDPFVNLSGVICSQTRFEGMLWGRITRDGLDATEIMAAMVKDSKFHNQLNGVLIDGLTVAGFNIVDLPELAERLDLPCIAVMRFPPDLDKFFSAMTNVEQYETRKSMIERAGKIHSMGRFHFQVSGCQPTEAAELLERVTDTGNVPEALRLAHLIGAAIKTGSSSKRA